MAGSLGAGRAPDAQIEIAGVVIPPDPQVITPAIRRAMLDGRFEAEEAAAIPRIVRPGDRVLEIGAGIGFISTCSRASAGSAGWWRSRPTRCCSTTWPGCTR